MARCALYVNHYEDPSPERRAELARALEANLANPMIDRVVVLAEAPLPRVDPKLIVVPTHRRPTFRRYFEVVNATTSAADLSIVANSDVYFDESLAALRSCDLRDRCIALTRWEVQRDGTSRPLGWSNSQDAWVFRGHVKAIDACDYSPGLPACDWRLAAELRRCGYELYNPSEEVRAHHLHLSGVRRYTSADYVQGEHAEVPIGPLATIRDRGRQPGLISFSLFGSDPRYVVGAEENVRLAGHVYPGWRCRFYVDDTVPADCVQRLRAGGAEVVAMPRPTRPLEGAFWRFLAADDEGFERWIVRDADSRLGYRERRAVDEWIESGASFHIMRDHPWHRGAIMAGGFGGVRGVVADMAGKVRAWTDVGYYGADEAFLATVVYPLVRDRALQHSCFPPPDGRATRPFPTPYEDFRFVGERFGIDRAAALRDREALIAVLAATAA
jgi:hypothetical protein